MTDFRDQAAIAAMQAIVTHQGPTLNKPTTVDTKNVDLERFAAKIAESAFRIADAMVMAKKSAATVG